MPTLTKGPATRRSTARKRAPLPKAPTGIRGLDEITFGGLPRGRPTLLCGGAGCGKTLLAVEFLVRGAALGEPGVFVSFEETPEDLAANVASLGFDLDGLIVRKQLVIDNVHVDPGGQEISGSYSLDGLFARLGHAIDSIGAKRVVIDTIEVLFGAFPDDAEFRGELRRLFEWLKRRRVTAIVTGEKGTGTLTRRGLEEYVSDCVLVLDHRTTGEITTRKLRVVKYRGSAHGTNDYPFLIDEHGVSVLPITSLSRQAAASEARVSTGSADLDRLLGGGYFAGSTVLYSGPAGTGKTTMGALFLDAACRRGERAILFSFEESAAQILRNMRSVGIDLQRWVDKGLLRVETTRPSMLGLEAHLVATYRTVAAHRPSVVALDPVSALLTAGEQTTVLSVLTRLIDSLKAGSVTALLTSLSSGSGMLGGVEDSGAAISSLVDTWVTLRSLETNGERNRTMFIMKSRGSAHSNQVSEYTFSAQGVRFVPAYAGPAGALTGTARVAQEARDRSAALERQTEHERAQHALDRLRAAHQAKLAQLEAEYEMETAALSSVVTRATDAERRAADDRDLLARSRGGRDDGNGQRARSGRS